MKIFIAHPSSIDYEAKLYGPLRASALATEHELILPHARGGIWNSKEEIRGCDAFVADLCAPSTGAGVELGWADAAGIPIIVMHEKGTTPAEFAHFLTDVFIEYESPSDMVGKLAEALNRFPAKG